jgi:hypothetical protein
VALLAYAAYFFFIKKWYEVRCASGIADRTQGRTLHSRPGGGTGMSMQGPGGAGGRDPGAQRWGAEQQEIDKQAQEEHLAHEAERIHAEEAAERGDATKSKRPWWKFWA